MRDLNLNAKQTKSLFSVMGLSKRPGNGKSVMHAKKEPKKLRNRLPLGHHKGRVAPAWPNGEGVDYNHGQLLWSAEDTAALWPAAKPLPLPPSASTARGGGAHHPHGGNASKPPSPGTQGVQPPLVPPGPECPLSWPGWGTGASAATCGGTHGPSAGSPPTREVMVGIAGCDISRQ